LVYYQQLETGNCQNFEICLNLCFRDTPGLLFGFAFVLFLIGPAAVYLLPDDSNVLIAVQVIAASVGAFGGAAAFGGASLLSTLQK